MSKKRDKGKGGGTFKARLSRDEAAERLEELARGLREGRLSLDDGASDAAPQDEIRFKSRIRRGKDGGAIKLRWRFHLNPNGGAGDDAEAQTDTPDARPAATLPDQFSF